MTIRPIIYGAGALFVSGAVGWEIARRHATLEMEQDAESKRNEAFLSGRDVWRSVEDDVEPTLLDNPDGVIEYHRQLTGTR